MELSTKGIVHHNVFDPSDFLSYHGCEKIDQDHPYRIFTLHLRRFDAALSVQTIFRTVKLL